MTCNINDVVKLFVIFKEGVTDLPVTIVRCPDQSYDVAKKIEFYQSLGYTIVKVF